MAATAAAATTPTMRAVLLDDAWLPPTVRWGSEPSDGGAGGGGERERDGDAASRFVLGSSCMVAPAAGRKGVVVVAPVAVVVVPVVDSTPLSLPGTTVFSTVVPVAGLPVVICAVLVVVVVGVVVASGHCNLFDWQEERQRRHPVTVLHWSRLSNRHGVQKLSIHPQPVSTPSSLPSPCDVPLDRERERERERE